MAEAAVVVPFKGEWNSLIPLLEALKTQTIRQSIEVVLSVDGNEKPPESIASLTDSVINGNSAGPASARNRGWRSCSAAFILFTDSDCVPEPDWAEKMLNGLRGEYDAVKGIYSQGGRSAVQRLAQIEFQERYRIMAKRDSIFLADTYSAGFMRNWLEKLDGFDESFPFPDHEDVDLSWRLIEKGGLIGFIPGARVAHTHRSGWIRYFRLKKRRGKWRLILVRRFPEKVMNDGYTPQTMKLQMVLWLPLLISIFLLHVMPYLTVITAFLFLITCLPMMAVSFKTDRAMCCLVPFFAFWRAAALSTGAVSALLDPGDKCLPQ